MLRLCREYTKRLSATDISALASMKNVAKCDTWCELQNPVNHRVFERKLRPKPLGRGHVCLGVTHRCPHPTLTPAGNRLRCGRTMASRAHTARGWPKIESSATTVPRRSVVMLRAASFLVARSRRSGLSDPFCAASTALASRPQVRRDYPLNLSISISGGKETYKDSLSNGERTGNSPA
ncbi:hypothetical protein HRI_005248700 [Hibiscus trionum]|uniref:Uncharacterized protein n=1 Tax=Hibiscus trionum TaxID=183268 RepID=A0A9W7JKR9_HIBTR|nr:hypothetical protein HRI_005248700 [Hibiscus trionum]